MRGTIAFLGRETSAQSGECVSELKGWRGECVKGRLKEGDGECDETSSCASSCSASPNTRGELGWRRWWPTVCSRGPPPPPPSVQPALYGLADAEANMIAAGRRTHMHMKRDRQKEGNSNRDINSDLLSGPEEEFYLCMTDSWSVPS